MYDIGFLHPIPAAPSVPIIANQLKRNRRLTRRNEKLLDLLEARSRGAKLPSNQSLKKGKRTVKVALFANESAELIHVHMSSQEPHQLLSARLSGC